jgi:hypothetical protein
LLQNEKGCRGSLFKCRKRFYFLAGTAGAGAPGFGVPAPSTGSTLINFPKDYGNFNGFGDVTNAKTFQERASLMKMAEANKLNITVPGRTDYTVGQKVGVVLNKIEPMSKNDKDTTDKMFSGYYIVAAINHYIDKAKPFKKFWMKLNLRAYETPLSITATTLQCSISDLAGILNLHLKNNCA